MNTQSMSFYWGPNFFEKKLVSFWLNKAVFSSSLASISFLNSASKSSTDLMLLVARCVLHR